MNLKTCGKNLIRDDLYLNQYPFSASAGLMLVEVLDFGLKQRKQNLAHFSLHIALSLNISVLSSFTESRDEDLKFKVYQIFCIFYHYYLHLQDKTIW